MATVFLDRVGIHRQFLIVFLSDGQRWQFFKINRDHDNQTGYTYEMAPVIDDAQEGWELYLGLLNAEPASIGWLEPTFSEVELKEPLGQGSCAVAAAQLPRSRLRRRRAGNRRFQAKPRRDLPAAARRRGGCAPRGTRRGSGPRDAAAARRGAACRACGARRRTAASDR